MAQPEEAREVNPWSRTFRNSDNPSGPDFRPQFVSPDMPFAEDLDSEPHSGLTVEEVKGDGTGDVEDPKDSTVPVFVASSQQMGSSPMAASPPSSGGTTAVADTGVPGVEVPEA